MDFLERELDLIEESQKNYADYVPTHKLTIEKYLNEEPSMLWQTVIRASQGDKSLLIAPTGAGKTYSIINVLKEMDIKAIFVVPNAVNVEQIKQEYDIAGASGNIGVMKELEKDKLITVTWDKFAQIDKSILDDYIVVIDEIHQLYIDMYRIEKIGGVFENLRYCKGEIDITATPNKLDFGKYDYILEYDQQNKTKYNVKLYNKIDYNKAVDIARNSTKFAYFENNKNNLKFIQQQVFNKNVEVINADVKTDSKCYHDIVFNSSIGNAEGICNTSVLVAGVNIYEPNITDIIIVGEKDIATIKQYIARFRDLKKVNVHIFNNYKEECKVFSVEKRIEKAIAKAQKIADASNNYLNITQKEYGNFYEEKIDFTLINLKMIDDCIYWNNDTKQYEVNEIAVRNKIYKEYYNLRNIEHYKVLLGEYFDNIEIVEIEEPNNDNLKKFNKIEKMERQKILDDLSKHKEELVGAKQILDNNIDYEYDNYFVANSIDVADRKQQLINMNIPQYIAENNIAKVLNCYSNYIVKNGFTYNMAWTIANKGNFARGNIFKKINNVAVRRIQQQFDDKLNNGKIENRLYNLIVDKFERGASYTEEHLELFIADAEALLGVELHLTTKKLANILNVMFKIDKKQTTNLTKLPLVDNSFLYNMMPTTGKQKKINIYTIQDFLTVDDIAEELGLNDLDKQVLNSFIDHKVSRVAEQVELLDYLDLNIFA